MLSVGDLFIIPGVWKVGHCYVWASCSLSLEFGKLGAICSLSQEFGKLVTVMCGRFVHYPREFGKLTSVICGRFVYYPRSLVS